MSTRLTDEKFFNNVLDTSLNGLEDIPSLVAGKEFDTCRKIFADYVRKNLQPKRFFSTLPENGKVETIEELLDAADMATRHYMISVGIPYDFGDAPVDWTFNPTENGYKEWPFQLNRHREFQTLAEAYRTTGDKRYADACSELFTSWIEQVKAPESCNGHATMCWRTIECGIRQGLVWPEVIHSFVYAFSDDVITDWCKSVWEHGNRLYQDYTRNNWLVMEMNGLAHIGILYPWFKEAAEWYDFAIKKLAEELDIQVYPDGVQFELTTDYAYVVLKNMLYAVRTAKAYEKEIPQGMMKKLEKMLLFYVRLMRPDGKVPSINDGAMLETQKVVSEFKDMFPKNKIFEWAMGCGSKEPEETSYVFEYPGLAVLRTGWSDKDSYVFFDGGELGKAHRHEDKLSVLFYADGKQVLTEGNSYAYDTSEMRQYVLSTRAHNTVRVDGKDQNRKKNYYWDDRINVKSNLNFKLSDKMDVLSAIYDEGYGEECEINVKHSRKVLFVKSMQELKPFLIVVDRLEAEEEHSYEVMWHLDAENIAFCGLQVKADSLRVLVPQIQKHTAGLDIKYGIQSPEWQGWTADSTIQNDYRPIYNLSYMLKGSNIRWVTVWYPDGGEKKGIVKVEAGLKVEDTDICLTLDDGLQFILNEE